MTSSVFFISGSADRRVLHSFPTRRSSDLFATEMNTPILQNPEANAQFVSRIPLGRWGRVEEVGQLALYLCSERSEEHTSELQSRQYLVCRLLLEKKKKKKANTVKLQQTPP